MAYRKHIGFLAALAASFNLAAYAQQGAASVPAQSADPSQVVVQGLRDQSKWFRAESPHFVVYSDTSQANVRQLLNNLERFDRLLRAFTSLSDKAGSSQKLRFYYEARQAALKPFEGERPYEAVGLYTSCPDGVQAFAAQLDPIPELEGDQLIKHALNDSLDYIFEAYARHFLYRHTDVRAPVSYIDGFAQFFASARFAGNEAVLGRVPTGLGRYFRFLDAGQEYALDYKDVIEGNDTRVSPQVGPAAVRAEYLAKVWLLMNYIMSTDDNRKRMRAYLDLVRDGTPEAEAFVKTFGMSLDKLSDTLWRYRIKGVPVYRGELPGAEDVGIQFTPLKQAEGELVLVDAALKSCPGPRVGPGLLKTAADLAREHPNNEAIRLALSRAQIDWGKPTDALPFLDAAIKSPKPGFEALYLHGLAHLRLAQRANGSAIASGLDTARASLQRAAALNPKSPQLAFAQFQVEVHAGLTPPQAALSKVVAAWREAHEVTVLAQAAALVHAYRNDAAGAWRAMSLVQNNRRDPAAARWARELAARLEKGMTRGQLVDEMRRLSPLNAGFREWTVATRDLMRDAEARAGLKNLRNYLEGQMGLPQPGQPGLMPQPAPALPINNVLP